MKQFFKDILTGIDGESYDIARVVIAVMTLSLLPVLFLGVGFYLYGYWVTKVFDIQGFFTAITTFVAGVGTLLTTGAAAIFFKKTTEPSTKQTTVENVTGAKQSGEPEINKTNIVEHEGSPIIS